MRDIKDYEGLYAITSCGRVWSYRSKKFLKPRKARNDYLRVCLYKDGRCEDYYIHRLVAEAYIPNPNNLPQVNHKDRVRSHNWINNLEWCDAKYNVCYSSSKKVKCVETGEVFDTIHEAAESIGRATTNIVATLNGRQKTCGGYHWIRVEEGDN